MTPGRTGSSCAPATPRAGAPATGCRTSACCRTDEPAAAEGLGPVVDRDQLERGFRRLSIDHRAVVVLHHYLDLPLDEVAETLGVPRRDGQITSSSCDARVAGGPRGRRPTRPRGRQPDEHRPRGHARRPVVARRRRRTGSRTASSTAVLDAVPATPQRRSAWPAWRSFEMPSIMQRAPRPRSPSSWWRVVGLRLLPSGERGRRPRRRHRRPTSPSSPRRRPTPRRARRDPDRQRRRRHAPAGTYRRRRTRSGAVHDHVRLPRLDTSRALDRLTGRALQTQRGELRRRIAGRSSSTTCSPIRAIADRGRSTAASRRRPSMPSTRSCPHSSHERVRPPGPSRTPPIGGHPAKTFQLTNDINTDTRRQAVRWLRRSTFWDSGVRPHDQPGGTTDQHLGRRRRRDRRSSIDGQSTSRARHPTDLVRRGRAGRAHRSSSTSSPIVAARPPASRRRPFDARRA